ncbi:MAG: alpha-hydroxy-acid oxidizing protein [Thermoanaerobaculia bacterium]|nr:alpha-hydroxy-acid oxidizing protein [Thermoanaerobaculia bacterium]
MTLDHELLDLINLDDFEAAAKSSLTRIAYDYYASGSDDEITLVENRNAYSRLRVAFRVLRDVTTRDLRTTVLGHELSMPVLAAPTAFHRLANPDGELATARAASTAGSLMILSTLSTYSLEEVTSVATCPVWFQLYVYKDRGATAALVRRAEAAGCTALVLTVDAQIWGRRERDIRNRFHLPGGVRVKNLLGREGEDLPKEAADSGLGAYVQSLFDPSLSWKDIEWLASLSDLPVVLKGIVHPDDACLALSHGAQAVVVSNHGGRQLDTSVPTIEALPEVLDAVGDRMEVLVDGGIRRGTDVLKALALGARAVAIGRPVLWGLATAGQAGVERVFDLLRDELDRALGLAGARSPGELDRSILRRS